MKVKVDFGGGLDLVFNNQPEITMEVEEGATAG